MMLERRKEDILLEPLISVVMITYNHECYIRQAVESVLKQKRDFEIEILIGNDASTDNTGKILDELNKDGMLRLFQRKKNLGASANLYELLTFAEGRYIAFLEGDDYWTDYEKLQKQYEFLEKHTEYIGCTHECMLVDEMGTPLRRQYLEWISRKRVFGIRESMGFYLSGQIGTLMCRNIFRDMGEKYDIIYKAHPMISDRTIQMVLALEGTLYRMEECMGAYRLIIRAGEENATSKYFVQNTHSAYDNFMMTCCLEEYARKYMGNQNVSFDYIKKLFFTSAVIHGMRGRTPEIKQDIEKILDSDGVEKWRYILFLPRGFFHKIIHKFKI